jgi:hypothetical protein
MNEFLIECSLKQYSMALKFDLLIQRYAILIPRYAPLRRIYIQILYKKHSALCGIARDQHICVNSLANSKQN